jgi:hypothetical protein
VTGEPRSLYLPLDCFFIICFYFVGLSVHFFVKWLTTVTCFYYQSSWSSSRLKLFLSYMPVFSYICIVVFKHKGMTRSYIFSLVVVIILHGAECHRCSGSRESFWGMHNSAGHRCAISQILLLHLLNWLTVSIALLNMQKLHIANLSKDHVLSYMSIIDWVNLFFFVSGRPYNL